MFRARRHLLSWLILSLALPGTACATPPRLVDTWPHPAQPALGHDSLRGQLVEVRLESAASSEPCWLYERRGAYFVAGVEGDAYGIVLRNLTAERLLVVPSVDGVNVLTGQTASVQQDGYVLEPWQEARIDGWRKSLDEVARFVFTARSQSYAARTGRPDDVGVIGLAVFQERHVAWFPRRERQWPVPTPAPFSGPAGAGAADGSSGPGLDRRAGDAPAQAPATRAPYAQPGPPDAALAQAAPPRLALAPQPAERLGTGHGERIDAPAQYTNFVRASTTPAETLRLEYDSLPNLQARGIVPRHPAWPALPRPFPGDGFVPDPPG